MQLSVLLAVMLCVGLVAGGPLKKKHERKSEHKLIAKTLKGEHKSIAKTLKGEHKPIAKTLKGEHKSIAKTLKGEHKSIAKTLSHDMFLGKVLQKSHSKVLNSYKFAGAALPTKLVHAKHASGKKQGVVRFSYPPIVEGGVPPVQDPPAFEALAILKGGKKAGSGFPTLARIPAPVTFSCSSVHQAGFYADVDTDCQVFRRCDIHAGLTSYLCPNQTIFNQIALVCDWYYNVNCSLSVQFYDYSNARLYHSDWQLLDQSVGTTTVGTTTDTTQATTEEPVTDSTTEGSVSDTTTEEPVSDTTTETPVSDTTTEEPVSDTTTEEPVSDTTTEEPVSDTTTEGSVSDTTTEEPVSDTTTEAPVSDTTTEEPVSDTTTEAPVSDTTTEEPVSDTTTEEPVSDTTTEAPVSDTTTEEPVSDTTTEEPVSDTTTEGSVSDTTTEGSVLDTTPGGSVTIINDSTVVINNKNKKKGAVHHKASAFKAKIKNSKSVIPSGKQRSGNSLLRKVL